MDKDLGASAEADRATAAEPVVSALRDGVPSALYTHNHAGWRRHDLPGTDDASLMSALHSTHGFLAEYEGKYRVEIVRTPEYSFDGKVLIYWDSDEPKHFVFWCRAFEFNEAPEDACRFCGGTGIDHYSPFSHCWACDGTAVQIRTSTWRGFMHKPVKECAASTHAQYAEWLAAQAIEAGTGETHSGSTVGESAVGSADAPETSPQIEGEME